MPPAPVRASDRPALVTVPNVEILEVGTWATSTGVFTFGIEDLQAAVAAYDDPGYTTPVIKLGHVDPRFDGEPALGRLINPRLSDDAMTLIVDIAGVPTWLADIMATAFPRRSIEGSFGHQTQTGSTHRFALTALSLLGVEAPAVSTLADIAVLFGIDPAVVAASAAHSLEENMPASADPSASPVRVAASVNLDTVRNTFYSYEDQGSKDLRESIGGWPWIREVYNDFVVVDDDEGHLFQVPWSESPDRPGEVVWGTPVQVHVEYVPMPADKVAASGGGVDALRRGSLRARLASMSLPTSVAATEPTEPAGEPQPDPVTPPADNPAGDPTDPPAAEPEPIPEPKEGDLVSTLSTDVRSRLGLSDDADDTAVLAAVEALKTKAETPTPDPELVAASTATEKERDELRKEVSVLASRMESVTTELAATKSEKLAQVKASVLAEAKRQGKFTPADEERWSKDYDDAPAAVTRILASIAPGTAVPVAAAGYTGTDEVDSDTDWDAAMARLDGPTVTKGA